MSDAVATAPVYAGQLPREAAISNVQIAFGLNEAEASALFPEVAPQPAPKPEPAPKAKALDLPDVRQDGDYDCGSAAVAAVCQFYGVGPDTEAEYIEALGTTEADGTSPDAIKRYLPTVGLVADARNDWTIKELAQATVGGKPVLCVIQDYESEPYDIVDEVSGHWVVVCGADEDKITLQDPSAGFVEMPTLEFLSRWEDTDGAENYTHYGIAVSKPKKSLRRKAIKKDEKQLHTALQQFFRKQADALLEKSFTKALPADDWFDIDKWTAEMFDVMRPIVALYYDHSAKQTVSRIGAGASLLKVVQPKLKAGMDKATLEFCKATNESTSLELNAALKALRQEMTEGLEAGEVQNQLAKRVRGIFDQAEVTRSYLIAHTEASRSQHAAAEITAKESGLVSGKKWLLSADACPKCLPLAGKVVPLGESFTTDSSQGSYAEIQYPPRHPGCRCDMTEVIDGVNDKEDQ